MTDKTTRTFIVGSRPFKFANSEGEKVVREPGDLIPEAEGFSYMVQRLALESGRLERCVIIERDAPVKRGRSKKKP